MCGPLCAGLAGLSGLVYICNTVLQTASVSDPHPPEIFFAPCPRGLEATLAEELTGLGASQVHPADGGVGFRGDTATCYRVNLESRIASRVLWLLVRAPYRSEEDVYCIAREQPWSEWFGPEHTIKVNLAAVRCPLRSLDFLTLRIKDAICDHFREVADARPSVDTRSPDVRVHAFLDPRHLAIYLDSSGEPLFKRGLRAAAGEAPLRENLAAGILRLAGWQPDVALLDPMCGGGTFLLEAARIALAIPAGWGRSFGFEKLHSFDRPLWESLRDEAGRRRQKPGPLPIFGSDRDAAAIRATQANLEAAGLARAVRLKQADVLAVDAPAPEGVLIANPPYGVRLGERQELGEFYPRLGDALKRKFSGWRAYIFTADLRLPKLIRLAASRRIPLYNGALECRLLEYKLVAGSMRKRQHGGR